MDGPDRMPPVVREAPLLWAQQPMWRHYRTSRRVNTVSFAVRLPAGCSRADVVEALRRTTAAHEVLRTTYREVAGEVRQVVAARWEPVLDVREVGGYLRPEAQASRFLDELRAGDFVLEEEPPFRFGLVERSGVPSWLLFASHHIAVDGLGAEALGRVFARTAQEVAHGLPAAAGCVRQPCDEAEYEASSDGVVANDAAMRHWAEVLDTYPPAPFPVRTGATPRRRPMEANLTSAELPAAIRALAREHHVVEPVVVLSAFAAGLLHLSGNRRTAIRIFCSNRYRPELADYVGCLTQNLPVVVAAGPGATFSALLRTVAGTLAAAYRLGRYDFEESEGRRIRAQWERGVNLQTTPGFNYVTHHSELPARRRSSHRRVGADAPQVVVTPNVRDPFPALGLNVVRSAHGISLAVPFNAATLAESTAEGFVRGLHDLLRAAARDPRADLGALLDEARLPGPSPDEARWFVRDGTRVCLDDVETVLLTDPAVLACRVEIDTGGPSPRLTAHVTAERANPASLRAHCVARLPEWPAAIVPDRFVLVTPDGVRPSPPATGVEVPSFDTTHAMAPLLQRALELTNPGACWEGATCYLAAGGRLGRIGSLLDALAGLGATGLDFADLSGLVPPAELLGKLRPLHR